MNDEVPGEGDFDAGRRRGEFDDITWRILAVVATPGDAHRQISFVLMVVFIKSV